MKTIIINYLRENNILIEDATKWIMKLVDGRNINLNNEIETYCKSNDIDLVLFLEEKLHGFKTFTLNKSKKELYFYDIFTNIKKLIK